MSLQFFIGRSGTGKTSAIHQEIAKKITAKSDGPPIIVIVPEQMSYQTERRLCELTEQGGTMRAQVYSLTRLAWRVMQEVGGIAGTPLGTTGLHMLIRSILEEKKDELREYSGNREQAGFIDEMRSLLTEMKRYIVAPEQLREVLQTEQDESTDGEFRTRKLQDISKVFEAFEASMDQHFIDQEDTYTHLASQISRSRFLQTADVYVDGFHDFTPMEYSVLKELIQTARNMTIALTVDRPFRHSLPEETHLFRATGETYATLYEMARSSGVGVEKDVVFTAPPAGKSPALTQFEHTFEMRPIEPYEGPNAVVLAEAQNRRAEIEGIARNIRRLVQHNGYRYRDIALLLRNANAYDAVIESVFADYEIPYFCDEKKSMLHHPLVELLRSAFDCFEQDWRYEAVFRAAKTELLYPNGESEKKIRGQMDRLENYCLAYGIKGRDWRTESRWGYRKYRGLAHNAAVTTEEKAIEQEVNESRLLLSAPLLRLERRLAQRKSAAEKAEALYLFCEEIEVPAKLDRWRLQAEESGDLLQAKEHEQAWDMLVQLLDEFVEIFGDQTVSTSLFIQCLTTGLEAAEFSNVPPSVDQIVVAHMDRSRLTNLRCAFVVGLQDGVLPQKPRENGLLDDEEREWLARQGIELAPSSHKQLLDEEFAAYRVFSLPTDALYVSYPVADEEGKGVLPSPWWSRLQERFPTARKEKYVLDPSDLSDDEQLAFIANPHTAITHVTHQFQRAKRGEAVSALWWDTYNALVGQSQWKESLQRALRSLTYKNDTTTLTEETSRALYGEELSASVSRMESFFSCPFSHYSSHGLRLREREVYQLHAPHMGELFHEALKHIHKQVVAEGDWRAVTVEGSRDVAKKVMGTYAPALFRNILGSSKRYQYIARKLEQVLAQTTFALSEQARRSGFSPVGLEVDFGQKGELPPFTYTLSNGTKVELRGRIDRIDRGEVNGNTYIRIIDYKSSSRGLDLGEVYHGLSLQMLTYLDLVLTNGKQWIGTDVSPAGVFYFHIHNPQLDGKKAGNEEAMREDWLKSYKMNGYVLGDTGVVQEMDQQLSGGSSPVISAGLNKDGSLRKSSKAASIEHFSSLTSHVRTLFREGSERMMQGDVDISPYQYRDRTPCTFCSFRSVCQLDHDVMDKPVRHLPKQSDDAWLAHIIAKGDMT